MLGKLNAISVFTAWALLGSLFAYLGYAKLALPPEANAQPLFWLFSLFLIAVVLHLFLAYFVRCPQCQKCLTVQGLGSPHPSTSGGWAKVVFTWFSGRVQCIHCGATVDTKNL